MACGPQPGLGAGLGAEETQARVGFVVAWRGPTRLWQRLAQSAVWARAVHRAIDEEEGPNGMVVDSAKCPVGVLAVVGSCTPLLKKMVSER